MFVVVRANGAPVTAALALLISPPVEAGFAGPVDIGVVPYGPEPKMPVFCGCYTPGADGYDCRNCDGVDLCLCMMF